LIIVAGQGPQVAGQVPQIRARQVGG